MAGVQRRIRLMEELQSDPETTSPKAFMNMSEASSQRSESHVHAVGLPLLMMILVAFAALSTGGGVLVALEVLRASGRQDVGEMRTVCFGVFGATTAVSLALGLLLSLWVSRSLRYAVSLMERCGQATKEGVIDRLSMAEQQSRILDVRHVQVATSHILHRMGVFKRYLPETVVRDILQGDARARRLHVARRNVTIMFSDIRDFTTISEKLSHHNLLFVLTRYLSIMTRIVEAYEGVVAEILGDGLLVFWNTPDDVEQHAAKACAAALAQCEALLSLNPEFETMNLPELHIRVGIHTGTVLTGNIGSERKMKWGCMGDPVNLASRLEGLCKNYGVSIICSGTTWAELPEDGCFCTRQLDLVQVKGKNEPTRIYEVIGLDTFGDGTCETPRTPRTPDAEPEARRIVSFADVAKEAMKDSTEAMGSEEVESENPFVRMISRAKRRLSSPGSEIFGSRRSPGSSSRGDFGDTSQVSFSEFARGVASCRRGAHKSVTPEKRLYAEAYESALCHYQEARFVQARDLLRRMLDDSPNDRAASRLLEQASQYVGPGDTVVGLSEEELQGWTGVTVMTEK